MSQRMERHGKWDGTAGENISFGHDTASGIICQLVVDDGVASRGHRTNMFGAGFKFCGIGVGPHKVYKSCCVLDYAGGFTDKK